MEYLLDANVFISAARQWYGFDFCPAFWDWLDLEAAAGTVGSIDRVFNEIDVGADQLTAWAQERPGFFRATDEDVLPHLRTLSTWATSGDYDQAAVNDFLASADYFLVAHCMATDAALVTHEVPSTSRKRIKIPDAALTHGVRYLNTFQLLRERRARFELYA